MLFVLLKRMGKSGSQETVMWMTCKSSTKLCAAPCSCRSGDGCCGLAAACDCCWLAFFFAILDKGMPSSMEGNKDNVPKRRLR